MFGPLVSHVTLGTRDLAGTAAALESLGLVGQRYPGGACFPVGPMQYIEVQQADPAGRPLQQWLDTRIGDEPTWCCWAVAVPDLTFAVDRGLSVQSVDQRQADDGFAPWMFDLTGTREMVRSGGLLPYLIRYGHDAETHERILRERVGGAVSSSLGGFAAVAIGDPDGALRHWLEPVGGPPGEVIVLDTGTGISDVRIAVGGDQLPIPL